MTAARNEDGAVLVEFALVLPLLLLLVIGMLQFGIVLNAKIDETHLASSGARYAAVDQNPGPDTLQQYIKLQADTSDLRENAQVCLDFPENAVTLTAGEPGDPVRVIMRYTYELLPFLSNRLGIASIDVVGEATMRLETEPEDIEEGCTL